MTVEGKEKKLLFNSKKNLKRKPDSVVGGTSASTGRVERREGERGGWKEETRKSCVKIVFTLILIMTIITVTLVDVMMLLMITVAPVNSSSAFNNNTDQG